MKKEAIFDDPDPLLGKTICFVEDDTGDFYYGRLRMNERGLYMDNGPSGVRYFKKSGVATLLGYNAVHDRKFRIQVK